MKSVVHDRYGPPEVLRLETAERPVPASDEVLVRVRATSVTRADAHLRAGTPFVARLQSDLRRPKRRILGHELAGRWAGFEQAAGVADGAFLALNALRSVGALEGNNVLVYGASGSIGTAGVQLAKHFGAHLTAVCNTPNVELVRSLGAHEVIDYLHEDFTENGQVYDVVFDAVG